MERKLLLTIIVILILVVLAILIVPKPYNQTGFQSDVIAQNLQVPWSIDFLPNNTVIFTQRDGEVKIIDPAGSETVGVINVTANGESGLLGLVVDPEYSENNYIYVYYTASDGNRVSRFVFNGTLKNETVLLDKIPSNTIHNGGRIKFGPDGLLYITTGDAGNNGSAQDLNSLAGKILRIDKNGSVPQENLYNNYVYTYGHRDPQGLAWSPNGTIYESEHGNINNDEINILVSGANYGWPLYQGNHTAQDMCHQ